MSGTAQRAAEEALTERYEALLRASQTLISIRSLEELFSVLSRELRAVVNFYVMGVGIYDEKAHEMRLTSYGEPGDPLKVPKLAPEETFTWWVYQHQLPLIIPSLDAETRFPAVAEMLKNRGVRSVCALPLTTVHRRLGGLAVGSIAADAYSREEVSFLSLVANQVALAVDAALNFDASQHAKEALRTAMFERTPVSSTCGNRDGFGASGYFEGNVAYLRRSNGSASRCRLCPHLDAQQRWPGIGAASKRWNVHSAGWSLQSNSAWTTQNRSDYSRKKSASDQRCPKRSED
jgi:transcriptional regulator with GAF, ATPase, and Fis domain